jgi:hypothetical protein
MSDDPRKQSVFNTRACSGPPGYDPEFDPRVRAADLLDAVDICTWRHAPEHVWLRALADMDEAARVCLCWDLPLELWDRLRHLVQSLQAKVHAFAADPMSMGEISRLKEGLKGFIARLPPDRAAPPRDGVRNGKIYVGGVVKVPGGVTRRYEKLINLMWDLEEADRATVREAGIQVEVPYLRGLATNSKPFLIQAGVGWTIGVEEDEGLLIRLHKKPYPDVISKKISRRQ